MKADQACTMYLVQRSRRILLTYFLGYIAVQMGTDKSNGRVAKETAAL